MNHAYVSTACVIISNYNRYHQTLDEGGITAIETPLGVSVNMVCELSLYVLVVFTMVIVLFDVRIWKILFFLSTIMQILLIVEMFFTSWAPGFPSTPWSLYCPGTLLFFTSLAGLLYVSGEHYRVTDKKSQASHRDL